MILNEDYFDELEIKDEDIIDDVEEPEHEELTLDDVRKLPKQYSHFIRIRIDREIDSDATSIKTSVLPRILKRLDTILESYGIDDYKYVLVSYNSMD